MKPIHFSHFLLSKVKCENYIDYPDYPEVIGSPICLNDVKKKVSRNTILNLEEFKSGLMKIWDNCQVYNEEDSDIFESSVYLQKLTEKLLQREGIFEKPNLTKRMVKAKATERKVNKKKKK